MTTDETPTALAKSSPVSIVSYLASLLVVETKVGWCIL